jgi:hypothetical protein
MPTVKCNADDCEFNLRGRCTIDIVDINHFECVTYTPRDNIEL